MDHIFSISGFLLDKSAELLLPSPEPEGKIEFLGDSYKAAEGNEAVEQELSWEEKMAVTNIDQGFAAHIDWIQENVQQVVFKEKAKDYQDIEYGQFDEFPGGYVANGHPSVETHKKIANQIINILEDMHLFTVSNI